MKISEAIARAIRRGVAAAMIAIVITIFFTGSVETLLRALSVGEIPAPGEYAASWVNNIWNTIRNRNGILGLISVGIVALVTTAVGYLSHNFKSKNFDPMSGLLVALSGPVAYFYLAPRRSKVIAVGVAAAVSLFGICFAAVQKT